MGFRTACSRTAPIADLALWLVERSRHETTLPELFEGFCGQLGEAGLDLWRVLLGLETLHPELSGTMLQWQDGAMDKVITQRAGILTSESYLRSPTRIVDETGRPFRWRSRREHARHAAAGGLRGRWRHRLLDAAAAVPGHDPDRRASAYATRAPAGSRTAEIALLDAASRLFSPWAERALLRKIAVGLLDGLSRPRAGRRVYDGQIERGDLRTIRAAIWFCDLRGFTAMSDRLPRAKLIKVLNRWFELVGAAIAEGGGEILKFMGDGLLAVFPVEGDPGRGLRTRARGGRGGIGVRPRCSAEKLVAGGEQPLRCGLALHLGDVEFGNIGTPTRLDFTVIGPAVNMASRLEGLTKELGCSLVASAEFAAALDRRLRPLGRHRLRGIAELAAVYGLDPEQEDLLQELKASA